MSEQDSLIALHPPYLDDDGMEGVQFVRLDLAATAAEAFDYIKSQNLNWMENMETDAVWMAPIDGGEPGDEYYDGVPEGTPGAVRYWRFRP